MLSYNVTRWENVQLAVSECVHAIDVNHSTILIKNQNSF